MKSNKVYIVLLVILAIFFLVMFLLFGVRNIAEENIFSTIIVGNDTVWKYHNRRWVNIRMKSSLDELSWKTYTVYSNQKKLGKYELWYSDEKWYVFDKDKNAIPTQGNLLAYDSNYDLKIKDFTKENIERNSIIETVLEENNLPIDSNFSSLSKVTIDFDNDGVEEEFYVMSNALSFDSTAEKTFSIVFMVKNSLIYPIYNDIDDNNYYDGCKPYINSFLDVNMDNSSEMIISCGKYSNQGQIDMLYQFVDNSFKIIISNQ